MKLIDNISIFILPDNTTLISQFEKIGGNMGEPDVKLIEPFVLEYVESTQTAQVLNENVQVYNPSSNQYILKPWLIHLTMDNEFFLNSDKFLVSVDPTPKLQKLYREHILKSALAQTE